MYQVSKRKLDSYLFFAPMPERADRQVIRIFQLFERRLNVPCTSIRINNFIIWIIETIREKRRFPQLGFADFLQSFLAGSECQIYIPILFKDLVGIYVLHILGFQAF